MPARRAARSVQPVDRRRLRTTAGFWRVVDLLLPWLVGALYVLTARDFRDDDSTLAQIAAVVFGVVQGAALAWRRQRPELVTAVVVATGVPYHLIVADLGIPFAGLIAVWTLALNRPPRVSLVGLAGVLALAAVNFVTTAVEDAVFTMVIAVGVWALAEAARNRRTAIQEAARRAVSDEQARIARELHDVIAHSVSMIVVQAGAADDVFDTRPDQARAALRAIEGAGREALAELRRLLAAVRPDGTESPAPPQAGLDRVAELAEPLRAAGLEVVVTHEGRPAALPAGVDLSAYRIVQEALTNTLRHAQATVAEVTFRHDRRLPGDRRHRQRARRADARQRRLRVRADRHARTGRLVRWHVGRRPDGARRISRPRPHPAGGGAVTVRVVIADDQTLVRAGFRMILDARDDIEVVGEAEDGAEAATLATTVAPDVVLMDVRMPGVDGIEATRRIVASGSSARIIMLTTYDADEYVFAALRAGASGFMLKDVRPLELVDGIRVVARGDALLAASVTRRLLDRFVETLPDPASAPPDLGLLSEREVEVLRLVAAALSNAEISERLYVSEATVKTHVSSVLRKLGLRDRVQAAVYAYDVGLVRPRSS